MNYVTILIHIINHDVMLLAEMETHTEAKIRNKNRR